MRIRPCVVPKIIIGSLLLSRRVTPCARHAAHLPSPGDLQIQSPSAPLVHTLRITPTLNLPSALCLSSSRRFCSRVFLPPGRDGVGGRRWGGARNGGGRRPSSVFLPESLAGRKVAGRERCGGMKCPCDRVNLRGAVIGAAAHHLRMLMWFLSTRA